MLSRSLHGSANRLSGSTVKPRKRKRYVQSDMQYVNRRGKLIKAMGVPQLPEHVHLHLVRGFEPTAEMEADAAISIEAAKAQMKELHLREMRDGHHNFSR